MKKFLERTYYKLVLAPRGRGYRVPAEEWDSQYRNGEWNRLGSIDEMAHYSVIAGFVAHKSFAAGKPLSVLDIGCGHGMLLHYLNPTHVRSYLGVDLSREAVGKAESIHGDAGRFVLGDFEDWRTEKKFDVIVFNEVLYYSDNPVRVVMRHEAFLEAQGSFLVSIVKAKAYVSILGALARSHRMVDCVEVRNSRMLVWVVALFLPR